MCINQRLWIKLCPLPTYYVEALTSKVIVFGGRAFSRKLRLNKLLIVGS